MPRLRKGKTRYSLEGKILEPMPPEDFLALMDSGYFVRRPAHSGLCSFLYYFGVRISEALKILGENITIEKHDLLVDVGERLKHSKRTPPLNVRRNRPFVEDIEAVLLETSPKQKLWPYHRSTGWRIARRAFNRYPHYFRLNRITDLFERGYTITQIRSWTGLSLVALEAYLAMVEVRQMGGQIR